MCYDLKINRDEGVISVTSATDEGRRFLDEQYGGDLDHVDASCLSFFLDYVRKLGLVTRLMML